MAGRQAVQVPPTIRLPQAVQYEISLPTKKRHRESAAS
jgi:hypothetical protein